jgi:hypothetical protein
MDIKRSLETGERSRSFKFSLATVVFILLFTVVCYLLARSMVRDHFTGGGRSNNHTQR